MVKKITIFLSQYLLTLFIFTLKYYLSALACLLCKAIFCGVAFKKIIQFLLSQINGFNNHPNNRLSIIGKRVKFLLPHYISLKLSPGMLWSPKDGYHEYLLWAYNKSWYDAGRILCSYGSSGSCPEHYEQHKPPRYI